MLDLRNCDNMDLMREYPDNYFDLAIVDPPYGIKRSGQNETFVKNQKHKRKFFEDKKWDSETPKKQYFDELFRVSKNQIIWGANYFPQFLKSSMGWIFWDKGQDLTMSDGELAFSSFDVALRRVIMNRCELQIEGTIHPTQKPVKLYKWLLEKYAKQGDKILDTHLGSGSIAIACHYMGFDLVGCELDEEYFDAMQKRIKEETKQLSLF